MSPNRVFVQDKKYDEYVSKLAKAVSGLKLGDGFTEGVSLGPLINAAAVEKVVSSCDKDDLIVNI